MKGKLKLDKMDKKQKLALAVGIGLILLIILWPIGRKDSGDGEDTGILSQEPEQQNSEALEDYVAYQERRLKNIVEKIKGAGKAEVMITAKASREIVVEKDRTSSSEKTDETDNSGGTRITQSQSEQSSAVMASGQSGQAEPYVVKSLEPEIEGVVVAAQGAGDAAVAQEIVNTVSVLFDVPAHKVKVVQMKE